MQEFRKLQISLSSELDKICRANNIPYILCGHTAYEICNNNRLADNIVVPTIAMRYSDACKLTSLIDDPNRKLECFLTNRNISKCIIRYSDTRTTCIRVDEFKRFKYNGVCIDIEMMRYVPSKRFLNRIFLCLEALFVLCAEMRMYGRLWKALLKLLVPIEKLVLGKMYSAESSGNNDLLRITRFPQKSVTFPASYLNIRKEVEFDNINLYVPEKIQEYLRTEFDNEKHQRSDRDNSEDLNKTVIDVAHPYTQWIDAVSSDYGNGPDISWTKYYLLRGRMRSLRKKIEKYWDLLFFTQERFRLWKKYMPHKQLICQYDSQCEYQELETLLSEYLVVMQQYEKKDLALCFDKEIFEIALKILRRNKKENMAKRMQKLVFPEHLKPIVIERTKHD